MATMDKFMITNWCGVPHKFVRNADGSVAVDRFREVAESGINLVVAYDYGYKTNCEMLAACHELGLRVTLCDDRIDRAVKDAENRRELLRAVAEDYSGYPALLGYHIVDEPNSLAFPALAEIREILAEYDPAHEAYINLLPNYASVGMLGNPTYCEHLDEFIAKVKPEILSYDHYHFCKGEPMEQADLGDERQNQIYEAAFRKIQRPGFFDNIEDVRDVSRRTGVPFMVIILVTEHGPYRLLNEAEIRWEVFQSLCYGARRISYFTYWTPGVDWDEGDDFWHWKNGMIDKDGTRNPHYYMVARINRELQALGDILLPHDVRDVFHFGSEPDGKVCYWQGGYGDVTSMTAERMTVGFFDCGYVLLASKDHEEAQTVTFTVSADKSVRLYDKATNLWKTLEPVDGAYTLTLAAGDGELIRII